MRGTAAGEVGRKGERMGNDGVAKGEASRPHGERAETGAAVLCGLRHPVFQAGMAGIAGPELAAAVSEAGGLGHLGGLRLPPACLREAIREVRRRTDRPFGVNLVPAGCRPAAFAAQLRVVLEERPAVLSLFQDHRLDAVARARDAGIVVMVQVGSVAEARRAFARGARAVIAQGVEAGGHLWGTTALLPLLSAILEIAEGRPVLAAGGIVDRREVRAVRALGAAGVWVGTAFVATEESRAHALYKRRLLAASSDATEYRRGYSYGWGFGAPHRVLPGPRRFDPLCLLAGGARRTDREVWARRISLYAGQGVGRIERVRPAAELVAELAAGFVD